MRLLMIGKSLENGTVQKHLNWKHPLSIGLKNIEYEFSINIMVD